MEQTEPISGQGCQGQGSSLGGALRAAGGFGRWSQRQGKEKAGADGAARHVRLSRIAGGVLVVCELPKRSPSHTVKLCRQAVTEDNLCRLWRRKIQASDKLEWRDIKEKENSRNSEFVKKKQVRALQTGLNLDHSEGGADLVVMLMIHICHGQHGGQHMLKCPSGTELHGLGLSDQSWKPEGGDTGSSDQL